MKNVKIAAHCEIYNRKYYGEIAVSQKLIEVSRFYVSRISRVLPVVKDKIELILPRFLHRF